VLDIGCGGFFLTFFLPLGGLVSESFANLGASVIGSDASYESIQIASAHSIKNNLSIEYLNETAEELSKTFENQFDVISSLEIIEHVDYPELFIKSLSKMLKPEGVLFVSSLNKTFRSYLMGIIGAEYILNWVFV
jgi:2-polyprenyl-6-hydroxyphenyl methylase / 3-demethylubiquinone-9 3-methyltransferase